MGYSGEEGGEETQNSSPPLADDFEPISLPALLIRVVGKTEEEGILHTHLEKKGGATNK